jgi:hypothetical protein
MAPKFTSMAVSTCEEFFSLPRGAATRSATSCSQFTFQTANLKLPLSNSQASSPVLFVEAPGRPVFLRFVCPLAKARGMARQGAQPFVLSARGPSRDRGAPLGAPPRQACAVRAYLRASSLRRRAALFVAAPNLDDLRQPSSWRAARIGHQAEPRRRPGACLRGTPAGAASGSTTKTPLDDAPR